MDRRIPDARIYVVEFRLASGSEWEPSCAYPSGQVHSYTARKEAVHARRMMIYNSPYYLTRNVRIRKYAALSVKEGK